MKDTRRNEAGAALVTVLLFTVVVLILIASMLAVAGNEIVIAGLQRDRVQALELAQAGIQEAIQRIAAGRPYSPSFTSSLNPAVNVSVFRRYVGTNAAYVEIQATATAGRATRRLSSLILQQASGMPPNIVFAPALTAEAEKIVTGDVYAKTYINYLSPFIDPTVHWSYAGWRMSMNSPTYCYDHASCVAAYPAQAVNFYPGTRRSVPAASGDGIDIQTQTNRCPAGGGGVLPTTTITGILASDACNPTCTTVTVNQYGFDVDNPGAGNQAVTAALPCGLPYKYMLAPQGEPTTFLGEDGLTPYTRLFKFVAFDQWFNNYWTFDPVAMVYSKNTKLTTYPQFGAVPPPPDATTASNYDTILTGGGTLVQTQANFGCKYPEMACTPAVDQPVTVLLNCAPPPNPPCNWTLSGTFSGHGTMVVYNGNISWTGTLTWWGTIVDLYGSIQTGLGINNKIYGGLVATIPFVLHDATQAFSATTVAITPVGRSSVFGKAWWEW